MDIPDGKIKRHERPTPYLGGVALYCGFLLSLALILPFENQILLLFIGFTLLFVIGLIDDLLVIEPYQKFFGQIIAALCFLKAGFYLKERFFFSFINIPLSFLWILSIINAFNLVDVMDGLAALLALVATSTFLVIAFFFNLQAVSILLCAFLGSVSAFFIYNRPPAKIYLGDAGSLFIGSFLATIPFLFNWSIYTTYGYITPIIILVIPLLEVGTLILIRLYKRIPFYKGSPDHFSIYLQNNGWSKFGILLYIFTLSCALAVVAILFVMNYINISNLTIFGLIFLLIWYLIIIYRKRLGN